MQIIEGAVHSLKCPQHKCNALVTPAMVRKICGDELFRRYDELLLASALNTMNDIVSIVIRLMRMHLLINFVLIVGLLP